MLVLDKKKESKQIQILSLFEENLPSKPYCADEKGFLQIRPKTTAILRKHIQHNEPTKIRWLVYDCDYAGALEHVSNSILPPPNLAAINPKNGNSHLFYCLQAPVCISENGRAKPQDFMRKISFVLGDLLKADQGYSNFISKNPLHDHWQVLKLEEKPYQLNDFLDWFDIPQKLPKTYKLIGVGRNVTIFENGRRWAYRQVLSYRLAGSREAFSEAVLAHCDELNQTFPTPLNRSEIKSISKSISNWTWKNYTARWSDEKFSEIQAKRGQAGGLKSGAARLLTNQEKRAKALSMASTMTQRAIAEALGVSVGSVNSWLKARVQ
jgi:hypothetical protein